MFRVTIKNLLARKFRLVLTSIAVMLGVAFMAGTLVLTDTMGAVFDDLFTDVNAGVDVAVRGKAAFEDSGGGPGQQVIREPIDDSVVGIIEGVQGVAAVQGGVALFAVKPVKLVDGEPGDVIQHGQAPNLGFSWGTNEQLSQAFQDVVGHQPQPPDEGQTACLVPSKKGEDGGVGPGDPVAVGQISCQVALDRVTAEDAGISDRAVRECAAATEHPSEKCRDARVEVIFPEQAPVIFDVVATFRVGSSDNLVGATSLAFDTESAQVLFDRVGRFDEVRVIKTSDVTAVELRDRIRQTLREEGFDGTQVLTGTQLADDSANEVQKSLSFFNTFLLVFALIALFVGAFIIYNTFSIIVAQRTRELGLMRALGASGSQVTRSVAVEAFVVGLLSSVLGLLVGIGFAIGLQEALRALDIQLPSGQTVIATRTIVVSVLVGTVITFVSAIAPARRAATVPPMAALREHPTAPSSGRRRYLVGLQLALIGLIALAVGLFADVGGIPGGAAGLVGIAGALVFVGIAMLSPLIVQPIGRFLGWPAARFRGMAGALARENATRNPRRTASTAAALMVGLALVTLVATLGASVKETIAGAFETDSRAEFSLTTGGFQPISVQAAQATREALPGGAVTEFRPVRVEVDGETKDFTGVDTNLAATVDVHPRPGAMKRFREKGGLLLFKDVYDELPRADRRRGAITVEFATGTTDIPIAGVFDQNDAVFGNNYLLSMPLYDENVTDPQAVFVSIKLPAGMSRSEGRRTIEAALEPFPDVEVQNRAESQAQLESQINQFLNLMYVLLALAVLIALLGIVNALALSVFERTHEIGLLRAVGMTRSQVRRMIRYEAVIIAVFGSLLGLALGLVFGRAIVQALKDDGIGFALPTTQIVVFVVLAAIAGLVAGWFPARRAAKLDVLRAVQSE